MGVLGREKGLELLMEIGDEFVKEHKDKNLCLGGKVYEMRSKMEEDLKKKLEGVNFTREEIDALIVEIMDTNKYNKEEKNILLYYCNELRSWFGYV